MVPRSTSSLWSGGLEAAARDYFAKSAAQLTPGEAALIAGLVPAPSRYQPRRSPEQARWRRALVLRDMVEAGWLTEEDALAEMAAPVFSPIPAGAVEARPALAYVTQVRREVRRVFGDTLPTTRGFTIDTPLRLDIQAVAEAAVREAVDGVVARQGYGILHPAGSLSPSTPAPAAGSAGEVVGACFVVRIGRKGLSELEDGAGKIWIMEAAHHATLIHGDEEHPARPLSNLAKTGLLLEVCAEDAERVRPNRRRSVEGAAVVLDHRSGEVLALVGGYADGLEGFVRASQARRQPGSSFKPYVYAAAMLNGLGQSDIVVDAPISLPAGDGKMWSPKNYDGGYQGRLPLRRALAKSLNTVAVRLAMEAGPANIAHLAEAMGVRTPLRKDLTLALGSSEVTPLDQALGYATIARMGMPTDPVFMRRVVDVTGREAVAGGGLAGDRAGERVRLPGGPLPRALPAGVAYELADMLRAVVEEGTARSARRPGLDRGGKTGTTNGFLDAWFVGFTPEHVIAVWIGTDGTESLGMSETGGRAALPAWIRIAEALGPVEGARLPVPDEAIVMPTPEGWRGYRRGGVPPSLLRVASLSPAPLP
jgi:penicillin-binding protein 1A